MMTIFTQALLASTLVFALPGAANAQTVTIGSDVATNRAVTIGAFDPLGQSFTSVTDTLTSFGFEFTALNPSSANAPLTFSLFAGETLTGTSLFTTSFTLPATINSRTVEQFFDIALPNLTVVRGGQYTGVLTATSDRNALLVGPGLNVQTGVFTGGDAFAGGRLVGTPAPYANCAGAANNCDANFRVTGNIIAAAVPEPSTWVMLLFGFAGAGAMLRRSARSTGRRIRYNFA